MSRHTRVSRHYLRLPASLLLLALPHVASAGELMPFEVPEDEIKWDEVQLEEFNTRLPVLVPEKPAEPVDNRPDWPAPKIDAYFDASFSDANFSGVGYDATPGGYRFIAGFRMDTPALTRWSAAAEFGYTRIGRAERKQVVVDNGLPDYQITYTDTYETDLSALDFGARLGYRLAPIVEVYSRAGLQFYHASDKVQTTLDFVTKQPNIPDRPQQVQQPASSADARANVFGALGVAVRLGDVPSLYAEYGARAVSGAVVYTGSVGVLLNF